MSKMLERTKSWIRALPGHQMLAIVMVMALNFIVAGQVGNLSQTFGIDAVILGTFLVSRVAGSNKSVSLAVTLGEQMLLNNSFGFWLAGWVLIGSGALFAVGS